MDWRVRVSISPLGRAGVEPRSKVGDEVEGQVLCCYKCLKLGKQLWMSVFLIFGQLSLLRVFATQLAVEL